jgi:prevent-host-death family protein
LLESSDKDNGTDFSLTICFNSMVNTPDIVSPTSDSISSACILSVESSRVDQLESPGMINHQPFRLIVLQSICVVNTSPLLLEQAVLNRWTQLGPCPIPQNPLEISDGFLDYFGRFGYNRVKECSQVGGGIDMTITATELKANLGKYLLLAASEDIFITRNGKVVARLTSPYQDKLDTVDALFGSIPATMTLEEAREERLEKI